jgi:WD40 repeat protein
MPPNEFVVASVPPVHRRGERCALDGKKIQQWQGRPAPRKTHCRAQLTGEICCRTRLQLPVMIYRGHHYAVTSLKLSPSGCYVASGDERGMLRVWAFDHEEHLVRYESVCLTGPLRDIDWDSESKRLAIVGERSDPRSECAKVLQWDTGVTVGELAAHSKGRVSSTAFKPERPYRIVTAGKEDHTCHLHKGPPFQKVNTEEGVPCEQAHTKGAVNCIQIQRHMAVSVGTDKGICSYEGKTLALIHSWKTARRKFALCLVR